MPEFRIYELLKPKVVYRFFWLRLFARTRFEFLWKEYVLRFNRGSAAHAYEERDLLGQIKVGRSKTDDTIIALYDVNIALAGELYNNT